jgi:hypothetical protein
VATGLAFRLTIPEIVAEPSVEITVTPADIAARLGAEPGEAYPEVIATCTMIGEMERAAAKLLRSHLQPGQLSVGVRRPGRAHGSHGGRRPRRHLCV